MILEETDFTQVQTCTHIYSTALAGPRLYGHLFDMCTHRICVLDKMWLPERLTTTEQAVVRLSGSGEQRRLFALASHKGRDFYPSTRACSWPYKETPSFW